MNVQYTTDKTKRCMYCKGREVKTYIDGKLINNSLEGPVNGFYYCKDKKECQKNIEAENTQIIIRENGYTIEKDGNDIIDVEFKNPDKWFLNNNF